MKPVRISYPWLSTLGAILVVLWQLGLNHAGLLSFGTVAFADLPAPLRDADNWPFALAG